MPRKNAVNAIEEGPQEDPDKPDPNTGWVLLTGVGCALYKDGQKVANFTKFVDRGYIDSQLKQIGVDELVERPHAGAFPECLDTPLS